MDYIENWLTDNATYDSKLTPKQREDLIYNNIELCRKGIGFGSGITPMMNHSNFSNFLVSRTNEFERQDLDWKYKYEGQDQDKGLVGEDYAYGELKEGEKFFHKSYLSDSTKLLNSDGMVGNSFAKRQDNKSIAYVPTSPVKSLPDISYFSEACVSNTSMQNEEIQIALSNLSLSRESKPTGTQTLEGLMVDEFPSNKIPSGLLNSTLDDCLSTVISPSHLNKSDGEIKYYKNIKYIEDQTFLPRHFQHHKIKLNSLNDYDSQFKFYKNKQCPKSSEFSTDSENQQCKNLADHRYSRKWKADVNFNEELEILCRLCRGKNWIRKSRFKTHLSLSHGVLSHGKVNSINLIPLPNALFESRERKLINLFVECSACAKWIKLGNPATLNSKIRPQKDKTHGLYYNYFSHYILIHKKNLLDV
ncbi:hypothetical protein WICMUC_000107 [Wickerhamomyces mucosus]|uniref:Transcription regulator Rua1 C-terminal domain-containing protein n=1 Tax=Wickerhamomyces mucosus TaxID=1378264 RepID=A0A9P8TJ79_9ASCO|nr:hypothetical protein WICMUC_000107 [Wickerhamomyces mucosus]